MNLHLVNATASVQRHRKNADPDWQKKLPEEWRGAVIAPLDFATWHEYEMPASRCLGYDEDGEPCYYRHVFLLGALRWDDDEEYYEDFVYGEDVQAWRLRDERWLTWRIAHQEDTPHESRGFFSFSDEMPR